MPRQSSGSILKPLRPADFHYWKAQHLLNRAGFGGGPDQARALAKMGLEEAVDTILEYRDVPYDPVQEDEFDADIMRPRTQAEQTTLRRARREGDEAAVEAARKERQRRQREDRRQMAAFRRWWLARLIESPRPLEEKMTLFWHGHFATSYRTIEDSYHMFRQNQLFRSHATGSFRNLVHGIVHDPAMLRYLNNNRNRRQRPNENLARELMELFTLGEGNAYTERDIKEAARALTGYTYADDEFAFREQAHDTRPKTILGRTGTWDGDDLVEIILARKEVSEFLCLKLYRFFVNDLPEGVDGAARKYIVRLARRFRDSGYDIKTVLRTIFLSAHFYDDANVAARIKSPIQLIVQAARSLRTPIRSLNALLNAADLMGQNIGFPPSVKGWDGSRAWINTATMFVRQNLLIYMLTGQRPETYAWEADGAPYDATPLLAQLLPPGADPDPREAAVALLRFNLGTEPLPERVDALVRFIEDAGGSLNSTVLIGALSLIAAMPEYQLC